MLNQVSSKKIALFSHSSYPGGAETAFINLIKLVILAGHEAIVFLPYVKKIKTDLFSIIKSMNIEVEFFERKLIYPNISSVLLDLSTYDNVCLVDTLKRHKCELVISNSSSFLEGALAAENLKLPHIWSIHEIQEKNPEQPKGVFSSGALAHWFTSLSDHLIFCSNATKQSHLINTDTCPNSTILAPFLEDNYTLDTTTPPNKPISKSNRLNLMFIGAPTVRKNPVLAIEILAALRARGNNAYLYFIGNRSDRTGLIESLLRRRKLKPYVFFLGKQRDPYQFFAGKSINLICSKSEPFGLTVPESLIRGIPVVAPNFDGPSETLKNNCQFDIDNIDQCVRLIEHVADNYLQASHEALENYKLLQPQFVKDYQVELVSKAIDDAVLNYKIKTVPFELRHKALFNSLFPDVLSQESIIESISMVTGNSVEWVSSKVEEEKRCAGSAVNADMHSFDVVPYQSSEQMNNLYSTGVGFALELAANYADSARIDMAAFILVRLCTERTRLGANLRVLAVGDGIGSDSIRLAGAGFDVDYIDYDTSVTSKVALQNFIKFSKNSGMNTGNIRVLNREDIGDGLYDAVISLEVIEHVDEPLDFLDFLNSQLKPEGLLFLSDCFPEISLHWQTHLLKNERLSGLTPMLTAQCGFELDGFNLLPPCKPYVFRKSGLTIKQLIANIWEDSSVISTFVQAQSNYVSLKKRKRDKLKTIFRRLAMRLRGFVARQQLSN